MPWNGSGVFSRVYSWVADAAAAIDINANRMDTDTNDIAAGLNNCRTLDGQTIPVTDLPMNTHRHTNVGNGTVANQYAAVGQLQNNSLVFSTATGTSDAILAAFSPANASLIDGMQLCVRASAANTTTTPTFAPDGLAAHTITRFGGTALVPGDIAGPGHDIILQYTATSTRWELLNPKYGPLNGITAAGTPGTTMTFPSTTASIARTDAGQTFTGTQVIPTLYAIQGQQAFASSPQTITLFTITNAGPSGGTSGIGYLVFIGTSGPFQNSATISCSGAQSALISSSSNGSVSFSMAGNNFQMTNNNGGANVATWVAIRISL